MMTLRQRRRAGGKPKATGQRQKAKTRACGRGWSRLSACTLAAVFASAQAQDLALQTGPHASPAAPLSQALDSASYSVGGWWMPSEGAKGEGATFALGLRGVQLHTGVLGAEVSGFGTAARFTQTFSWPLLGYAEVGTAGQLRWNGGWRLASDARLGVGPLELSAKAEKFTAPLALLLPLEALADPRPDTRAEGWNAALETRYRVGQGTVLLLGKTWGGQPRSRAELELRPQLWAVDGGRVGFGLSNPSDDNPDIWAESLSTLTLRAGGEWGTLRQGKEGASLRVGAGWKASGGTVLEAAAVLGTHTELSAQASAYDLWREGSEWRVGVLLSDAWAKAEAGWPVQLRGEALLPVGADGWKLEAEATTGAAGSAGRLALIVPLR